MLPAHRLEHVVPATSEGHPVIEDVTVETCLTFAVMTEKLGAELYQGLAQKFAADVELRELFEGLGRDEVHHGEQIRAMGGRLVARVRGSPLTADEQAYLRAWSMSEVFSGPAGLTGDLGAIQDPRDALKRALQLEKATLGYYHAMRDVLGADAVLDSLIAMERTHVVKVTARLVTQTMLGGLADSA